MAIEKIHESVNINFVKSVNKRAMTLQTLESL